MTDVRYLVTTFAVNHSNNITDLRAVRTSIATQKHTSNVSGYFHNFFSENTSVLSRMGNLIVKALDTKLERKQLPLPKLIVVVPDDDLIRQLCNNTLEMDMDGTCLTTQLEEC